MHIGSHGLKFLGDDTRKANPLQPAQTQGIIPGIVAGNNGLEFSPPPDSLKLRANRAAFLQYHLSSLPVCR